MKIDTYFIAKKSVKKEDFLTTLNPIVAEAHYFTLCKQKIAIDGAVIVKAHNSVTVDAEYITGNIGTQKDDYREKNERRRKMIWANSNEWLKPCPLQMRGLAMACCGKERGYQTKFAQLLGVEGRTWRNWAKLLNNKKQIPWYAWYAALSIFMRDLDRLSAK